MAGARLELKNDLQHTHLVALVIVSVFSFGGAWALYWVTDKIIPLRVAEEEERHGLDVSQHNERFEAPVTADDWDGMQAAST